MSPNRPRQHVHNWQWKLTEFKWEDRVTQYSPGGFTSRRYWACTRGGKVKHTEKAPSQYTGEGGILVERPFIAASGIPWTLQKVIT